METGEYWDRVYAANDPSGLSWTQRDSSISIALIREFCPPPGRILDVGGGASPLAGRLLSLGYAVTVLDLSSVAMSRGAELLGSRAGDIQWIVGDVTMQPELKICDLWHDRAVFHFLTEPSERAAYAQLLSRTVRPFGHAIIATFTPDGPKTCSGLEVVGYDADALATEFGPSLSFVRSVPETHLTPWGTPQPYQYSVFQRPAAS